MPWLVVADGNNSVVLAIQSNHVTMLALTQTGVSNLKYIHKMDNVSFCQQDARKVHLEIIGRITSLLEASQILFSTTKKVLNHKLLRSPY